jgi:hypothetical protein
VTSSHIFFIPGMIMIGMFLGFILGARAAKNQADLAKRREAEREAARAARAAKRTDAKLEPGDEVVTAPGKSKSKPPKDEASADEPAAKPAETPAKKAGKKT